MNQCLELASGNYVARMDADDISNPNRIRMQFDFMEAHKHVGICGTQLFAFNEQSVEWSSQLPVAPSACRAKLPFATPVGHATVMYNKSLLNRHGIKYRTDCAAEDYDLWVRASTCFDISNVDALLYEYRSHGSQVTRVRELAIKDSANQSRLLALRNCKIEPSSHEFKIHCSITSDHSIPAGGSLDGVKAWLSKIANNKWQTVDDKVYMRRECQLCLDVIAARSGLDRAFLNRV